MTQCKSHVVIVLKVKLHSKAVVGKPEDNDGRPGVCYQGLTTPAHCDPYPGNSNLNIGTRISKNEKKICRATLKSSPELIPKPIPLRFGGLVE